jgi:hypothetical protein
MLKIAVAILHILALTSYASWHAERQDAFLLLRIQ